jgi:hypothetical protein
VRSDQSLQCSHSVGEALLINLVNSLDPVGPCSQFDLDLHSSHSQCMIRALPCQQNSSLIYVQLACLLRAPLYFKHKHNPWNVRVRVDDLALPYDEMTYIILIFAAEAFKSV